MQIPKRELKEILPWLKSNLHEIEAKFDETDDGAFYHDMVELRELITKIEEKIK